MMPVSSTPAKNSQASSASGSDVRLISGCAGGEDGTPGWATTGKGSVPRRVSFCLVLQALKIPIVAAYRKKIEQQCDRYNMR